MSGAWDGDWEARILAFVRRHGHLNLWSCLRAIPAFPWWTSLTASATPPRCRSRASPSPSVFANVRWASSFVTSWPGASAPSSLKVGEAAPSLRGGWRSASSADGDQVEERGSSANPSTLVAAGSVDGIGWRG
jgi:hypothetical protein